MVWVNRSGSLTYRTAGSTPDTAYVAPPDATLVDPLKMSSELGDCPVVKYGDKAALVETSAMSVYGRRDKQLQTELADSSDAQAFADRYLARREARHMPRATVHLGLANDAETAQLLSVDLDDVLDLPQLLPASPVQNYQSRVIGYEER